MTNAGRTERAPPDVAACYIVRNGRLLMVRRRQKEGALEWAGAFTHGSGSRVTATDRPN